MWFLPLLVVLLWRLAVPAGDVALYREAGGGTTVTSSGTDLPLDTIDEENRSTFELDTGTGQVTVKEACRVLVFAGTTLAKTTAGAETGAIRVRHDPNTGTFAVVANAWDMCYFPDANGVDSVPLAVAGLVNCVANSKLVLTGASEANDLAEAADRTFLQLFRLPSEAQVCSVFRSSNQTALSTTFADVNWVDQDVVDSNFSHSTSTNPQNVTWNGGSTRALLMASITFALVANQDRTTVGFQVLKNGTAINFTQATAYIRGPNGDQFATARVVLPLDLANGDVIKVQAKVFLRANAVSSPRVNANRSGLVIVAWPSTVASVNTTLLRHASNQTADTSPTDVTCDTEDEEDAAFSHSTASNTSEITTNRYRHVLFGWQLNIDRTASSTADDINWQTYLRKNNTTDLKTRGSGSLTEGAVSANDFKDGTLNGAMIVRAAPSDIFEVRVEKLGSGADASAVIVGGAAVGASLVWAIDLDDFIPLNPVATGEGSGSCTLVVKGSLEGRGSSEAHGTSQLTRRELLEGRGSAEALGELALTRRELLEARDLAEASGAAQASRTFGLEGRDLAEAPSSLPLARLQRLEGRDLAEAPSSLAATRRQLLEARGLGEAPSSLPLARLQRLEARDLAEASGSLTLSRLYRFQAEGFGFADGVFDFRTGINQLLLEARSLSEAYATLQLTRGQTLEARGLGEAHGTSQLTRRELLEGRGSAEAHGTSQPGVRYGLEGRGLGEAPLQTLVGLRRALEGRGGAEALTQAEVVRLRLLEGRGFGEAQAASPLNRLRLVEARALAEASGSLALRIVLGVSGSSLAEAFARVEPQLKRYLEARGGGESSGVLLIVESQDTRVIHLVQVRRTSEVFEVVRLLDLTPARRQVEIATFPSEVV